MITGVVLAAGRGERFGSDKLLGDLGGRPLVWHAVNNAVASSLDDVVVVVGDPGCSVESAIQAAFGTCRRVSVVHNPGAERGHLTSVKAGLRALPDSARAAVIILGDMPLVGAAIIDRLLDAHRRTGGFVVPLCGKTWRHPRVIPAAHFGDFLALDDDAGGGVVFERFRDEVLALAVGETWNYLDVDTADDLVRAGRFVRD